MIPSNKRIFTKRSAAAASGLALALTLVVWPGGGPSSATTSEANVVAAQVDAVTVTDPESPKLEVASTSGAITAEGDGLDISMPSGNSGDITLESAGSEDLTV